jgi:deazaflavin-dependent oxidoreductase (nitroreductase family)
MSAGSAPEAPRTSGASVGSIELGAPGRTGALAPVAPALVVRVVMRPMTKVLNPLIRKFAGRRHFRMAAQVHHVGRRSGRPYVTPAAAHIHGDTILIPLTFGNQSDWARNVRAAGGCRIVLNGQGYDVTRPEFIDRGAATPLLRSSFGPVERAGVRLLGIRQFMLLQVTGGAS